MEKGFTQIPNIVIEKLCTGDFSKRELKVLLALVRCTIGYNKQFNWMSGKLLENMTGIDKKNARKTINGLVEKGVIIKKGNMHGFPFKVDKKTSKLKKPITDKDYQREYNRIGLNKMITKYGEEEMNKIINQIEL